MDQSEYAKSVVDKEMAEHGFPDGTDDLRRLITRAIQDALVNAHGRLLRSEALSVELAQTLKEWMAEADERGVFCCGVHCDDGTEHESTLLCGRTAALLKKAVTE